MRGNAHVRFGGAGHGNQTSGNGGTAPGPDPYLERVNKEIKRRTNVVGIFANDAAIVRMVTAACVEQHDEWAVGESMAKLWEAVTDKEVPLAITARLSTWTITRAMSTYTTRWDVNAEDAEQRRIWP